VVIDPARLPEPPKPLAPDVKLVRGDGTPTAEYHQYMSRLFEWNRLLRSLLTETPVGRLSRDG
jgi:hypothetical protein